MSVVVAQDSEFAKEMRKHEATHTQYGPPGRPYVFQPFPEMMYRAARVDGVATLVENRVANDEQEQRNLMSRGFMPGGPQAAMEALTDLEQDAATAAAERAYAVRSMSEGAQAEVATAEQRAGLRHLSDIPETPIKRSVGRPRKIT